MKNRIKDFEAYLRYEKKYSSKTIDSYIRDLNSFNDFLIRDKIKNVDYKVIRDYLLFMYNKKYGARTISRNLSSLRSFYKYQINKGLIDNNPCALISNPKLEKKLPNFLSYNEVEDIIESASKDSKNGLRNELILELLYSTGMRVSEVVNIKIKDINFSDNQILVLGKGSKERIVLFGDKLKVLLKEYLDIRVSDSDYLIVNKYGKKMTTRSIEEIVKKSC